MYLQNLAELLYKLQFYLTAFQLLFEGKWWANAMEKYGVVNFHGLVMRAHNELVQVRGCMSKQCTPFAWDYKPFYSAEKVHRMFEDPLHQCGACRVAVRMRPTLKNLILKKLNFKKYRTAIFPHVD